MAKEIRQRMYALFAVLGIAIFFWFSFHQNGTSMSLFARDFVDTSAIAPEIWQSVNPFFVIVLTPIIMAIFASLSQMCIRDRLYTLAVVLLPLLPWKPARRIHSALTSVGAMIGLLAVIVAWWIIRNILGI